MSHDKRVTFFVAYNSCFCHLQMILHIIFNEVFLAILLYEELDIAFYLLK